MLENYSKSLTFYDNYVYTIIENRYPCKKESEFSSWKSRQNEMSKNFLAENIVKMKKSRVEFEIANLI